MTEMAFSRTVKAIELKNSMIRMPITPITLRCLMNTRTCSVKVGAYPGIAISRYVDKVRNNCSCSIKCDRAIKVRIDRGTIDRRV